MHGCVLPVVHRALCRVGFELGELLDKRRDVLGALAVHAGAHFARLVELMQGFQNAPMALFVISGIEAPRDLGQRANFQVLPQPGRPRLDIGPGPFAFLVPQQLPSPNHTAPEHYDP